MAGYTRQSSYADGDIIDAADSNDEYNQLLAAFVNTSGHKHDGTAAEGPVIGLIGDPGVVAPKNKVVVDDTNNQVEFNIDVGGTSTEQFVVKDGVIEPTTDNDIDLGSNAKQFKDAYINGTANIDALVADTADINGGTVDAVTLGTNSAVTEAQVDNLNLNGNAITSTNTNGNIDLTPAGTGEVNISKVDVASGEIDGTVIGGNSAAAVTGTTVVANTSINIAGDGATVTGIKDEDDMASNSADHLATQQSIKAYVDTQVATVPVGDITSVVAGTGMTGGGTSGDVTLNVIGGTGITANAGDIAIDSTVTTLTGTQTLTNKTLTSPTINGGSLSSAVTGATQSSGTSNTTIATTAFAVTEANNAAVAMAIALG